MRTLFCCQQTDVVFEAGKAAKLCQWRRHDFVWGGAWN